MLPLSALESILPRKRDFDRVVQERLTNGLTEIILALPANPEGDLTALEVERILKEGTPLRVTTLGRGLSTGSELEYADPETIKNALSNRR
jgi:recombination protein RecR